MCGIAGMVGSEDRDLLVRMSQALLHRGPDDNGTYVDNGVALANRRLSIIDLPGGHQPIHNEDETIWITFNGEIYNFNALKTDLEAKGHRFYTRSDTETIVHLYEEYGDRCVERLRGMFAFAVWDSTSKMLLLARDRIGIKPLYYFQTDGKLLFSSEMKSILQYEEIPRKVDLGAMEQFLTFRYIPGDSTILQGIKRLLPGHTATYRDGNLKISRYWDWEMNDSTSLTDESWIDGLRIELRHAVESHLLSDVPLGVFLSGGIDSSAIVAIMCSILDRPVKTFSVGFGTDSDELEYARLVANHFGTDHHELTVGVDSMKLLPDIVWYADEPVADPALIPTYLVSDLARRHVKVVLTGEGADEMFAGYIQYKATVMGKRYISKIPRQIRQKTARRLLEHTPNLFLDLLFSYTSALGEQAKRRIADYVSRAEDPALAYLSIVSIFDKQERKKLLSQSILSQRQCTESNGIAYRYLDESSVGPLLNKLLMMESKTSLVDNLLLKTDRMTMAHSLEGRVPYLDHNLVEYVCSMSSKMKLRGLGDKYALRKVMTDALPSLTVKRRKHRFFVPIDLWLQTYLNDLAPRFLSEETIRRRGYFKVDFVRKLLEDFHRSQLYRSRQLWSLLTLELWHRTFLDRDKLRGPASLL
jgi:asparagine synthase (glutamine-hydrolysing)